MELYRFLSEEGQEVLPEWLSSMTMDSLFNPADFFSSRVVFYPGSGHDGQVVEWFGRAHAAHAFIYCDYGVPRQELLDALDQKQVDRPWLCPFNGYRTFRRIELSEGNFTPMKWTPATPAKVPDFKSDSWEHEFLKTSPPWLDRGHPYAFIEILERHERLDERHGPSRLAILFYGYDAYDAYDAFYSTRKGNFPAPYAAYLQDRSLGFGGGNYGVFGRGGRLESIARKSLKYPRYLIIDRATHAWGPYEKIPKIEGWSRVFKFRESLSIEETMNDAPARDARPEGTGYIIRKASRYKALGPDKYRRGDFFQQPATDFESELLVAIASGMNQLAECKGFDELSPLEGIGIEGFYALMEVLHFEVSQQALVSRCPEGYLDRMEVRHVVTDMPATLYNLVSS